MKLAYNIKNLLIFLNTLFIIKYKMEVQNEHFSKIIPEQI